MLDTEKLLTIKEIQIDGLQGEYVLEVSDDQKEWKTLKKESQTLVKKSSDRLDFSGSETTGRFIRICFKDKNYATVSEVSVKGIVR